MAGIGFRLKKLLEEDTYTGLIKGHLYSAVISSGPMLTSIICIGLLGVMSLPRLRTEEYLVFRTTIVYVFALSIIFTGIFQMITTRYIADRLFMKEPKGLVPCFVALMLITMISQALIGSVFFRYVADDWKYVFVATSLYVVVSCLWNTMIFISAVKNYTIIFIGFLLGAVTSLIAGQSMGIAIGMIGYLLGFTIGQLVILVFLIACFVNEFDYVKPISFNFLYYFKKYPELCVSGLVINLAVWIDKFMFWFSPYGTTVKGVFSTFPLFDGAFFIAYLTIIPALSLFLMHVETSFYQKYREYYRVIMGKSSLKTIETTKENIVLDLKESVMVLLKVQGTITAIFIIGAVKIIQIAKLQWIQLVIFKIGTLSAFLLIFFQLLLIILYYFEFRKEACFLTVMFLITNVVASYISIRLGFRFFGYGFFASCFVCLFTGYFVLNNKLKNLECITFMSQPIQRVKI